ncbi:MAG: DUF87 domain-containing protein [Bryobacterales bacterium]|nr:DUF87 domain-containing protein [Bryobacterales bacterium]
MQDYERLGAFYLGKTYDLEHSRPGAELVLYDSRDLVTHAVVIGMTGSGKTGLCAGLIEEAAIDGIPAIVIDPKGDLGNLLLTFPELRAEDFLPWIDADAARGKGLSEAEYAARQAETWKKGLAEWSQDGERIRRLKEAAEFAIYTPASTAGLPVSILGSFAAPPPEIADDREAMRERVSATATSLLGLVGIEADPVRSREHVLLSTIFDRAWRQGQALDLGAIIQQVQTPPVQRFGALDLDAFFPARERFDLAMALNGILAAPGFEAWLEGEPLDIGRMLYTPRGKPRVAIFSIAHLADNERMFFVSLLLNQMVGWMRSQSGSSSLRAILYMDEIYGYLPPVANPPSKQPLLTLLKQARAFGLGLVLATQNPVDLDYKGLANAGTWLIGRLQTERDKARVLDGLEGAAPGAPGSVDRQKMDRLLSALGSRVFLLHNVHEDAPVVFQTRWALSYLRGPLTRAQIRSLMGGRASGAAEPAAPAAAARPEAVKAEPAGAAPVLPPGIPQHYLPLGRRSPGGGVLYRPLLLGAAEVHFRDTKLKASVDRDLAFLAPLSTGPVALDWDQAAAFEQPVSDLETQPEEQAAYAELPPAAANPRNYASWSREFSTWLYQTQKVELWRSAGAKMVSAPGESERDFRARLQQASREARDQAAESLRQKYAPKMTALQDRIRRAEQAIEREAQQASSQKLSTAISVGATLLGAFLGRKAISTSTLGRAATAARSAGRIRKESEDVERASESLAALQQQLADLDAQFKYETAALQAKLDPVTESLETVEIRPRKADISVKLVALAWAPHILESDGTAAPAW